MITSTSTISVKPYKQRKFPFLVTNSAGEILLITGFHSDKKYRGFIVGKSFHCNSFRGIGLEITPECSLTKDYIGSVTLTDNGE